MLQSCQWIGRGLRARLATTALATVAALTTRSAGATPPQPQLPGDRSPASRSAPDTAAGAVGPGDRIILRVWREPTWSDSVVVDPDGSIVLPRVGAFHAAGLPPRALADSVRARLAVYLREPVVDLVVLRRVAVLGAVRKPNVYYVDPVTTLREVLAQAGGIDDNGDPNRVEIVRDGVRRRAGRWRDVAESTAPVRSGDQVIVGRRAWFTRNALAAVSSIAVAASVFISATRR